MKTTIVRLFLAAFVIFMAACPEALAQRQLGKRKGPTSKLYIAEATGDVQIQNGEKIYTARQASAFDAPGTVIETNAHSRTAFVYSNGVAMTVGENSRVEINRFDQAPFTATKDSTADAAEEPSTSQSEINLARGKVGISTSKLVSGSSMKCSTPLASINLRGGNISIGTTDDETIIDLLDGSATVFANDNGGAGTLIQPGERIIIRRAPVGQPPIFIVSPIPPQLLTDITDFVTIASNARKTVTFEVIEKKAILGLDTPTSNHAGTAAEAAGAAAPGDPASGDPSNQEIVAKPTVPEQLPINVVVSPDRLPGQ